MRQYFVCTRLPLRATPRSASTRVIRRFASATALSYAREGDCAWTSNAGAPRTPPATPCHRCHANSYSRQRVLPLRAATSGLPPACCGSRLRWHCARIYLNILRRHAANILYTFTLSRSGNRRRCWVPLPNHAPACRHRARARAPGRCGTAGTWRGQRRTGKHAVRGGGGRRHAFIFARVLLHGSAATNTRRRARLLLHQPALHTAMRFVARHYT